MKAVTYSRFGTPAVLHVKEVPIPSPGADEVVVRTSAVSLNRADLFALSGFPVPLLGHVQLFLKNKKFKIIGSDIAGVIHSCGSDVTDFAVGDPVLGEIPEGALAEYSCVKPQSLVRKPPDLSFQQAASLPMAGVTALQALRDVAHLQPGETVLINGASGGVGSYAVQLARCLGAEVHGVCSTEKVSSVKALGAASVIDYRHTDFRALQQRYDVIIDMALQPPIIRTLKVLRPGGRYVLVGGPVSQIIRHLLLQPYYRLVGKNIAVVTATTNEKDLQYLVSLVAKGSIKPPIGRTFAIGESREAFELLASGEAIGKIVVAIA